MANMSPKWWRKYRDHRNHNVKARAAEEKRGYSLHYTPPPKKKKVERERKPHRFSGEVFRLSFFSGDPSRNRRTT